MSRITEREIIGRWGGRTRPVVSVCCTTYNHENYIREAIDGFLKQETDFPFEVIIRDDFSTDKTAEIIAEYENKYPNIIRAIYEPENKLSQGVQPMPVIFAAAEGEYLALCEGDDYWIDSTKLQRQKDFLDTNPEYGLVCTNMVKYVQSQGKYLESDGAPLFDGWVYEELIGGKNQIYTLTVCCRRNLLAGIPELDRTNYFTGDLLIYLHYSLQSKIKFLPINTAVYRVLEQSASHFRNEVKAAEFTYRVANTVLYYLDKYPVSTELHQAALYRNMLAIFKFSRVTRDYDLFQNVQLSLPKNFNMKMITLQILFTLCKWRPFFLLLTSRNKVGLDSMGLES